MPTANTGATQTRSTARRHWATFRRPSGTIRRTRTASARAAAEPAISSRSLTGRRDRAYRPTIRGTFRTFRWPLRPTMRATRFLFTARSTRSAAPRPRRHRWPEWLHCSINISVRNPACLRPDWGISTPLSTAWPNPPPRLSTTSLRATTPSAAPWALRTAWRASSVTALVPATIRRRAWARSMPTTWSRSGIPARPAPRWLRPIRRRRD